MNTEFILIPATIMAILTMIAWVYLFIVRIPAMKEAKIDLRQVRTRKLDSLLSERAQVASQHLINLFEVPVLFYVLIIFIYITNTTDSVFIYSAFAYVILRIIHSLIHLTYNNVMQRFSAYLLSCLVLWFMWAKFTMIIFQNTF